MHNHKLFDEHIDLMTYYNMCDLCSINAIKEVVARCPLAMTEDLLRDLVLYKNHKDKSE